MVGRLPRIDGPEFGSRKPRCRTSFRIIAIKKGKFGIPHAKFSVVFRGREFIAVIGRMYVYPIVPILQLTLRKIPAVLIANIIPALRCKSEL